MRIREVTRPGALLTLALALGPFGCAIGGPHFKDVAVSALDRAPNHGDGQPPPLPDEIRVTVSKPPASLAVQIVDPTGPTRPTATVFVLHGVRNRKESMLGIANMVAANRFRAVLVDLRGHGRSTGDWLSYGVVESRDMKQVLDELTPRGVVVGNVGVLGFSYGAATAIEWAAIDPRVKAVVSVASFSSLRAVVPDYLPVKLSQRFIDESIAEAGHEGGFDPDLASPERAITQTRAPVLIVHGDADTHIPLWHAARIYAAGESHSELEIVPGETHASIIADRTGTLRDRGMGWFSEFLR